MVALFRLMTHQIADGLELNVRSAQQLVLRRVVERIVLLRSKIRPREVAPPFEPLLVHLAHQVDSIVEFVLRPHGLVEREGGRV